MMKLKTGRFIILFLCCWLLSACTPADSTVVVPTPPPTKIPATPTQAFNQVFHNGIRLTYDPTLLGDVNIQDVVATTDQGVFGQPTPNHTWIGFVPEGIERDWSVHWSLLREPQIIVFNLNDFGSFAPSDTQARERIATFQQLLTERPLSFTDEVPILPLVNAAQQIQAQVQWLDFGGGTGLRFVTAYSQDTLPVTNEGLLYIFYGMTDDGLHGVTAVFPLTAAGLLDTMPDMTDPVYVDFRERYAAEMTAVTTQLNNLPDTDFNPLLSHLDALVQSIIITPTETDYPVTAVTPQNAQLLSDTGIFNAPNNETLIGSLSAGEAVVVNGRSEDARYSRILCADGSTGNCWLPSDSIQIIVVDNPEPGLSGGLMDGQVVQIQALVENVVFASPHETAAHLGSLRVGEVAEVFAMDDSGDWYNIACPRNIGEFCWVLADTAVNEPIGFFSNDGWKNMNGEYVSFRVPIEWKPTAVSPGGGSVLEEWNLGIPGVESDQTLAFFAVAFDALQPPDLESETPFEIGGQPGEKWVRSGQGYVSYDYYTTGIAGAGSFGIHVTIPEADPALEAVMDTLAASVTYIK